MVKFFFSICDLVYPMLIFPYARKQSYIDTLMLPETKMCWFSICLKSIKCFTWYFVCAFERVCLSVCVNVICVFLWISEYVSILVPFVYLSPCVSPSLFCRMSFGYSIWFAFGRFQSHSMNTSRTDHILYTVQRNIARINSYYWISIL